MFFYLSVDSKGS